MKYALEDTNEAQRLEAQSQGALYNYRQEFLDFFPKKNGVILDAGCGSGVVARYLAERFAESSVIACDFSESRVAAARTIAKDRPNLRFEQADLTAMSYPTGHFDAAISRFVIQHLNPQDRHLALQGLFRCLKPGGKLRIVDLDGMYHNLFPMPETVQQLVELLMTKKFADMQLGRKLPSLLCEIGFDQVEWTIETMNFTREHLNSEIGFMEERLANALPYLSRIMGSEASARAMSRDFMTALRAKGTVLFYNKFIVSAQKPHLSVVKES